VTTSAAAVIVAAGDGTRLAADVPKAFVTLAGAPLVCSSLGVLANHPRIASVVVVVPPGFEEEVLRVARDLPAAARVTACVGGSSRAASVCCGLDALPLRFERVLVHDAARPFVSSGLIDRVLSALDDGYCGAVPVVPLTDTVKRVKSDGTIRGTIDRRFLVAAQTPQGFLRTVLRDAIAGSSTRLRTVTDCSSLVEAAGGRVAVVAGDEANTKITTVTDLRRAERCHPALAGADEPRSDAAAR
jgi:2-C-methyl-D-erythritol 4-phosphate cytidylyltransferase/2-C-methyl-D-erythritol 2,4-cyclodiphosphate synthase